MATAMRWCRGWRVFGAPRWAKMVSYRAFFIEVAVLVRPWVLPVCGSAWHWQPPCGAWIPSGSLLPVTVHSGGQYLFRCAWPIAERFATAIKRRWWVRLAINKRRQSRGRRGPSRTKRQRNLASVVQGIRTRDTGGPQFWVDQGRSPTMALFFLRRPGKARKKVGVRPGWVECFPVYCAWAQ